MGHDGRVKSCTATSLWLLWVGCQLLAANYFLGLGAWSALVALVLIGGSLSLLPDARGYLVAFLAAQLIVYPLSRGLALLVQCCSPVVVWEGHDGQAVFPLVYLSCMTTTEGDFLILALTLLILRPLAQEFWIRTQPSPSEDLPLEEVDGKVGRSRGVEVPGVVR